MACGPGSLVAYSVVADRRTIADYDYIIHDVSQHSCEHYCTHDRSVMP